MYNRNGSFFPQNSQVSPPVFQQNTIRPPAPFQTDAQRNSQHVFGSNPLFQTPSQPPAMPNFNYIMSTPPPAILRSERNLPDWKNSARPRDSSYLPSQLSSPLASSDHSAPRQLNGAFTNARNGFVNNMEPFSSIPSQLSTLSRPPTFQMQSRLENRPGSFDQLSPARPSAFQQQSHTNSRLGSFDQQSPIISSDFQQLSRANDRPGSFNQQSPIRPAFQQSHAYSGPGSFGQQSPIGPAFQQQSPANNRPGSFGQQSHIRPSFQQQANAKSRPGSFGQQSPIGPAFQQQSPANNRPGSFGQQSLIRPAFQQQAHANSRPGSFDQQSPIVSSDFQQQSHANNRYGAFHQQSPNSNQFNNNNRNVGNNPFASRPFNNHDKNPRRQNNYNNKNRQNNRNGSFKGFNHFMSIKKEKEDKNSSLPFSCDPCDRSFDTENNLKAHLAEHIKCDSGRCQFEAHPKIVFLHKKMQHVAGYAEKISKLSSNEEIEKWRAERRRRFPTQENIARRQAEQAEKEARGEVMETPESTGKMIRKGDHQGKSKKEAYRRRRNRGRNQHLSLSFKPKFEEETLEPDDTSDDEPVTKLARFAGVNASISFETDEDSINTSGKEAASKDKPNSLSEPEFGNDHSKMISVAENTSDAEESSYNDLTAINSSPNDSGQEKDSAKDTPADENTSEEKQGLAASNLVVYDLSDDDDDAPIELPSKGPILAESQNVSPSQGTVEVSGDQFPSEKPVNDIHSAKKDNETGPRKEQDRPRRRREFVPKIKEEPKRCSISLLRALYADDIKTERNKMFQCLRYIVQNDFFGIGD